VKQICATILALVYLCGTVGATIQQHYCMGELVSTSLIGSNDPECGKCGMKKHIEASKDCCKDVSIVLKSGDSHIFHQAVFNFQDITFILPVIHCIPPRFNISAVQTENLLRAPGPPLLKYPLFIQYRNFRI
jgi:hypothetical protein